MDYEGIFQQRYQKLNAEQRAAVDRIEGPVMVVAGPGTGKTELLSMRVANILRQTDALPNNILCLTFTEAAATNMTERLARVIGPDAYKVEINTFHGFGSMVIGRYNEYFYNGASYQAADELTQSEILEDILNKLPFDNPLRVKNKDEFTYLSDLRSMIGDLKKAAVSPDELRQMTQQNLDFCAQFNGALAEAFAGRLSAKKLDPIYDLVGLAEHIATSQPKLTFTDEPKLGEIVAKSLRSALDESEQLEGTAVTKPITAWKKDWLEKATIGGESVFVLRDQKKSEKLNYAADIYAQYLTEMDQRNLYDFGDMIINVINAIHSNPDLKANLQEQYQYVLVDEFQDTNDAQMRLLAELTDYDDSPNLMVVGDDDQAIYRFQGADISNIQQFAARYSGLAQINLKHNYRSCDGILRSSEAVSQGITSRLTNVDGTPKQLVANRAGEAEQQLITATTLEHEFDFIARKVKELIEQGEDPGQIAIIGRKHKSLEQVAPYLAHYDIKVSYERQRNVLESPLVQLLVNLANLVNGIATGDNNAISLNLPPVIADPAFGLSREDFYRISLSSGGRGTRWLEQLEAKPATRPLILWLKDLAQRSVNAPLNNVLLELIGTVEAPESTTPPSGAIASLPAPTGAGQAPDTSLLQREGGSAAARSEESHTETFRSPIFDYYFSVKKFRENAMQYLSFLNDLTTLLRRLQDYTFDRQLKLTDFLNFLARLEELNIAIYSSASYGDEHNVQLMSAHGSKGLEFDTVIVIDAESEQWGAKSRSRSGNLGWPHNMPYGMAAGNDDDERRRLLYVAMTRAKKQLLITSHATAGGKELNALEYLLSFPYRTELPEPDTLETIQQLEVSMMNRMIRKSPDQRELLAPRLKSYRLSATDLNTFTDVMNGGPEHFLLYNLLRVPQGTSGALIFGNAIHHTMQQVHNAMRSDSHRLMDIDEVLNYFHQDFDKDSYVISEDEAKFYRDKGDHALTIFMQQRGQYFAPDQLAEQKVEAVLDGGIRLTGKIDAMAIDPKNKTIQVVDYKTGHGMDDFSERGSDYQKAKARRYQQQLMFYKLLIENSKDYAGYRVISGALEFVEPDNHDDSHLYRPEVDYSDTVAMDEFKQLVRSVWNHVIRLDLPEVKQSDKYKDIVAFEDWLRENP